MAKGVLKKYLKIKRKKFLLTKRFLLKKFHFISSFYTFFLARRGAFYEASHHTPRGKRNRTKFGGFLNYQAFHGLFVMTFDALQCKRCHQIFLTRYFMKIFSLSMQKLQLLPFIMQKYVHEKFTIVND